jgi:hypothetical protein
MVRRAGEAFAGPLPGRVDAHLGTVVGKSAGVIERIDGAEHELNVALGVDIVERLPRDFAVILHIHVFVDDDDHLGEHRLAGAPDRVHHLSSVTRVALTDGDQDQVVEDAFWRHGDVADFGELQAHEREEDALDGLAHVIVLHGRRTDDGGGVNRIFALCDAGDVKHRVIIGERVKSGVVAEGTFGAQLT